MVFSRFRMRVRAASLWWPATLAMFGTFVAVVTMPPVNTYAGPAVGFSFIGLTMSATLPRFAFGLSGMAAFAAALSTNSVALVMTLVAVLISQWYIRPFLLRLVSGVVLAAGMGLALTLYSITSERLGPGYGFVFQNTQGHMAWLVMMLLWVSVVATRAVFDAIAARRARELALKRAEVVEEELRAERTRRELVHDFHDVMAHSLAVLAAQSDGLRLSYQQHPERIGPVLAQIADTARNSLTEVRQVLEGADDDRTTQPSTADIDGLAAQVRSAGLAVTLERQGTPSVLTRVADVAAFRIVQEGLTNVLRHAGPGADAVVTLAWRTTGLHIEVSSSLQGGAVLRGPGRGISGMRERARLAGGTCEAGPEGERFVVRVRLPAAASAQPPAVPTTGARWSLVRPSS